MGRPPLPAEVKRRRGRTPGTDSGGRPLPAALNVTALPMADGVPDPPVDLRLDGRDLWAQSWDRGVTWLSPDSDWAAVVEACRLADDIAVARERYRVTREAGDARVVATLSKELRSALASLGFDPTARGRMGVAEVKKMSALETLMAKRREQSG
jgi:phage terminase small subunit